MFAQTYMFRKLVGCKEVSVYLCKYILRLVVPISFLHSPEVPMSRDSRDSARPFWQCHCTMNFGSRVPPPDRVVTLPEYPTLI